MGKQPQASPSPTARASHAGLACARRTDETFHSEQAFGIQAEAHAYAQPPVRFILLKTFQYAPEHRAVDYD